MEESHALGELENTNPEHALAYSVKALEPREPGVLRCSHRVGMPPFNGETPSTTKD